MIVTTIAIVCGLALTWAVGRSVSTWIFAASPTDPELLLATTLYWLGNSFGSSVRFYADSFKRPWTPRHADRPTLRAPTGIAVFPKELRKVSRELAREHANLVHWSEMPRGGHFAASEEPELLVQDLRAFFRPLRSSPK